MAKRQSFKINLPGFLKTKSTEFVEQVQTSPDDRAETFEATRSAIKRSLRDNKMSLVQMQRLVQQRASQPPKKMGIIETFRKSEAF
ncbi:MAG: hypothetical protein ACKVZJ_00950 [Phycisphaerales bacterium]